MLGMSCVFRGSIKAWMLASASISAAYVKFLASTSRHSVLFELLAIRDGPIFTPGQLSISATCRTMSIPLRNCASRPGTADSPGPPSRKSPTGALHKMMSIPAPVAAFAKSGIDAFSGEIISTASKPSCLAAANRSTNGSSRYINVRFALNFNMCQELPSRS